MKKRSTLVESTLKRAAAAKGPTSELSDENTTTAIVLPKDVLTLLQDVAHKRRQKLGGRASVSAIIVEALRKLEPTLRAELRTE
jgi:hypothetical protein